MTEYTVSEDGRKALDRSQIASLIVSGLAIVRIVCVLCTGTLSPLEAIGWVYLCLRYRTSYQMTILCVNGYAQFTHLKTMLEIVEGRILEGRK